MLEGLRSELERGYEIVAVLDSGDRVVSECLRLRPDAVLLDLSLPGRSGLEIIPDLRAALPSLRILVVTMHQDVVLANATIAAGANGFVPKDAQFSELRHAIDEVLAGRTYVSDLAVKSTSRYTLCEVGVRLECLSARQRDIVNLLGMGKSTASIAIDLHVSPSTVTYHRVRIRKALGLSSEWGLMRYAIAVKMSELRIQP